MPHKIYVGNVPERANIEDYEYYFSKCGIIVKIEQKNGFGFVEYKDRRSCDDAIQQFNGADFLGQNIRVELALSEIGGRPRGRSSISGDACFKCGGLGHFARECTSSTGNHNDSSRSSRGLSRPPSTSYDRAPPDNYSSRDSFDHRPSGSDRYALPPTSSTPIDSRYDRVYDRGYDRVPVPSQNSSSDRYSRQLDPSYRRDVPPLPPPASRPYDRAYDRPPYPDRDLYGAPSLPPQSAFHDPQPQQGPYDRTNGGYYPPSRNGAAPYDRDPYDRRVPPPAPPSHSHDRYAPYPVRDRSLPPPRGYDRGRDAPPSNSYRRSRSPPLRYLETLPPRPSSPGRYRPSRRSMSPLSRPGRPIGPPYGGRRIPSPNRRGGPRTPSPERR